MSTLRVGTMLRISVSNAVWLSIGYFAIAVGTELIRRQWNPRWADKLGLSLEAFPARILEFVGLYSPLRDAWIHGNVSTLNVRMIYGLVVVAMLISLGALVGLALWGLASIGSHSREPRA